MTKLLTGLAVGSVMLLGVGAAQAEPVKLTGQQMDSVTAGLGFADAYADAKARGGLFNTAFAYTSARVSPFSAHATSSSTACSSFFPIC